MNITKYLSISEEVKKTIENNQPVVALESTIISHGMPYPKNVETAFQVEAIVRAEGAVPATIAVLDGKIKVGLSKEEIDYIGKKGLEVTKASRRDLPYLLANKKDGATTVATTMIGASLAGINVFATGGIGGVHKGAETTMDISADLEELSNTSVTVVCAGVKSILDLGLTLEYLETKGVPVIGYQTDELPAFYTRTSGLSVDYKVESPQEIANIMYAKNSLNLKGGMVIANPIPDEFSMDAKDIESIITQSLKDADTLGIKGKDTTPFLLAQIEKLSGGTSLAANIKLVYNNAKLAANIAKSYCEIKIN